MSRKRHRTSLLAPRAAHTALPMRCMQVWENMLSAELGLGAELTTIYLRSIWHKSKKLITVLVRRRATNNERSSSPCSCWTLPPPVRAGCYGHPTLRYFSLELILPVIKFHSDVNINPSRPFILYTIIECMRTVLNNSSQGAVNTRLVIYLLDGLCFK